VKQFAFHFFPEGQNALLHFATNTDLDLIYLRVFMPVISDASCRQILGKDILSLGNIIENGRKISYGNRTETCSRKTSERQLIFDKFLFNLLIVRLLIFCTFSHV